MFPFEMHAALCAFICMLVDELCKCESIEGDGGVMDDPDFIDVYVSEIWADEGAGRIDR